jgi:hypothetical protein
MPIPNRDQAPEQFTSPILPTSAAVRPESRRLPAPQQTAAQPFRLEVHTTPEWHIPVYGEISRLPAPDSFDDFPIRRISRIPVAPDDERRGSEGSADTLHGDRDDDDPYKKFSLSSYQHPYDIPMPPDAYLNPRPVPAPPAQPRRSALRRSVSFADDRHVREYEPEDTADDHCELDDDEHERELKRRGLLSNFLDLYTLDHTGTGPDDEEMQKGKTNRRTSRSDSDNSTAYKPPRRKMRRADSMASMGSIGSELYDPDDPRVTGIKKEYIDDPDDLEKNALRQMDYKSRRKVRQRIRIEFNICCTFL